MIETNLLNNQSLRLLIAFALSALILFAPDLAFAASDGGVDNAVNLLNEVVSVVTKIAVPICVLVIIVFGIRCFMGHTAWSDGLKIIIGCLIIGGATSIADMLLN
jgi:type IV secretory pathway VirB2 component (pilin)